MILAELKKTYVSLLLLWHDKKGQDLIEYALLTASVALLVYGALPSQYAGSLSTIWSRVNVHLVRAGT